MILQRELNEIRKHYEHFQRNYGESVVWFEFVPLGTAASVDSVYDDVYDEGIPGVGGRRYGPGITVPVLMVSETEDLKRSIPEARQVTQVVNFVASVQDFREAGISRPSEYRPHLNDIFMYDGRYYSVTTYRIRGRARDDVMLVIEGIEIYINQEFPNDPEFGGYSVPDFAWPAQLPDLG